MSSSALGKSEQRTITACAEALVPGRSGMPKAGGEIPIAKPLAEFVSNLGRHQQRRMRALLWAFELSPPATGRPRRFSRLPLARREAHLDRLEHSRLWPLRDLLLFMKVLCSLAYCRSETVQAAIGFSSSCAMKGGSSRPQVKAPLLEDSSIKRLSSDVSVDVAVVGSGAGGAVAAYELAKRGLNVAILEEGEFYDRRDFKADPLQALPQLYRESGLTVLSGLPAIPIPVGRCVGGTTVINSGTCFRAPRSVLDNWRDVHGIAWADDTELGPIFSEIERVLAIEPVDEALMGENGALCKAGAAKLGASGGPISRYAGSCVQCSGCPTGCPIDAKQATHVSYLPLALKESASLYVGARVEKLQVTASRTTGLVVTSSDPSTGKKETHTVRAGTVVLAAGTLGTPEILFRSGLDTGSHPALGKNLHVHPACWIGARYDKPVAGWKGVMQSYYVDEWHDDGLLLEATFTPLPFAGHWLPGTGVEFERRLKEFSRVASIGVHLSDRSSGSVGLDRRGRSALRYKLQSDDVSRLVRGIGHAADIHFAAGATEVYPHVGRLSVLRPGEQRRLGKLKVRPQELRLEAFHPMGTARMGQSIDSSVTAADGSIHGLGSTYIADASLFPTSLGVNPMVTIMAFATHVARSIADATAK